MHAKRALERLASCYGVTQRAMLERLLMQAEVIKNRYLVAGGTVVDVNSVTVDRWSYWRLRDPLEFEAKGTRHSVDQDVRLILATTDALSHLRGVRVAVPASGS